jgi:hypothetical protein
MIKRTKHLIDEEHGDIHRNETAYLYAEKELIESQLAQELFEEEMAQKAAKIVLGKPRKAGKFGKHAKVSLIRKACRKPL